MVEGETTHPILEPQTEATEAMVGMDRAGRITTFNAAAEKLFGHTRADAMGKLLIDVIAPRSSHALEEENHRILGTNRLKSEFVANMSHELRTPLNAIMGFAELMFRGKVGPVSDNHKEYLGEILDSSRTLFELIKNMLDIAKVESGQMEFHDEPVELTKLTAEIRDILHGLSSKKGVRVDLEVDASAATAVLDPVKLKQVIYNYLSNALKCSRDEGVVTIRVLPEGRDHLRIEVQDRGIGVFPEEIHRLFVGFQRLDATTARNYPGAGMGLALTKHIVEAQGGTVGVRSDPGKGSTFWAVLPRNGSNVHARVTTTQMTAQPLPSTGSGP